MLLTRSAGISFLQGIPVMPVYSGLDVSEQPGYGAEFPGVFPFTR